ncbi:MAG: class I SAM-dependent methyltransferase [Myxococcota bacterium]
MREDRASFTAEVVALWRAIADRGATHVPGFRDPVAERMLGRLTRTFYRRFQRRMDGMPPEERRNALPAADFLVVRVAVIDRELADAVQHGCEQVVVLGAGYDTRAWRMPALRDATVWEVDHPSTQARKQQCILGAPLFAGDVRFVPVDFARDGLGEALARAGHDAGAPTVWVWEGVVMYLPDAALRQTLAALAARSAVGSRLILHYHEPGRRSVARSVFFRAIGERQVGLRPRAQITAEVERVGLRVERDLGIDAQAELVGAGGKVRPRGTARTSRILVATR